MRTSVGAQDIACDPRRRADGENLATFRPDARGGVCAVQLLKALRAGRAPAAAVELDARRFEVLGSNTLDILEPEAKLFTSRQDLVVAAGIKAILNFSPGALKVPEEVKLKSVDLTVSLESLSFYLAQEQSGG